MAYCTVAELKTEKGIESADHDARLTIKIDEAQKIIEEATGRLWEVDSDTTRTFDAERDVDGPVLWLDHELCQITTITNGDGTTLDSSDYVTEPRNEAPYYAIRLLASANTRWKWSGSDHEDVISIEGRWGYSTEVPADIKYACKRIALWLFEKRDESGGDGPIITSTGFIIAPAGFPKDVVHILKNRRRVTL